MARIALCALFLSLSASFSSAQPNLITNGDFDTDISNWTAAPTPPTSSVSHDPTVDGNYQPSGSLEVVVDFSVPGPGSSVPVADLDQCFNQIGAPGSRTTFGFLHQGQETSGNLYLFICNWQGSDCTGAMGGCGGWSLGSSGADFEPLVTSGDQFAGLTQSISFQILGSNNPGQQVTADVHVDKIFLREGDTFPPFESIPSVVSQVDLDVTFAGASSGGVSPFEPRYQWDFGDGSFTSEQNPIHYYAAAGTYSVTLQADSGFEQASTTIEVTVPAPVATPTAIPTASETGLIVLFVLLAIGGAALLRSSS